MRTRIPLLVLLAGMVLALAPAATHAATPFTAGTGHDHDLAVGATDGKGHVAWTVDGPDRVRYCRVAAGGGACETATFLNFPGTGSQDSFGSDVQVFAPAANKVVVLAYCTQCPAGGDRTYRFISTNNGDSFADPGTQVGNIQLNGQASYINSDDLALSVSGSVFQGQDNPASTTTLTLGQSGASSGASTAVDPGGVKAVYAVNEGAFGNVQYRVFDDPGTPGITAAELNASTMAGPSNWTGVLRLSAQEGNNNETRLDSGPNGIYLSYKHNQPTDNSIRVRKFNSTDDTFGAPTAVEGPDPIEDNGIGESMHSQDASGRLHVVWRSLHDGNRLRYTRSDLTGANFSAPANLALRETFGEPMVEAGSDGNGFAVWRGSSSAIRVVPIDPQPEPAGPGGGGPGGGGPGGDTTRPTAGGFGIGDPSLTPGQGTSFTFNSSEAGLATLTVQKRVPGIRVRQRGRRRCVPATPKRLRALRRRAGSRAAYRRLLRRSRCKAYKRIGRIQQAVTPGRNTIVFSGRIAGRRLRPGRYRALLVIRDSAGNVSRTEQVRFRVLRRRR